MNNVSADQVDIVRDFLSAHRITKRLLERFHTGELRFAELQELIGDDESSVLYRLKERCHALFRPRDSDAMIGSRGQALFDLAVGSLFHEAMKFRENFYQQEIYGPRVRALGSGSNRDGDALFQEFEKILVAVSERLAEGAHETAILIEQSVKQLRALLCEHPGNGFVLRYLLENQTRVEDVFGDSIEHVFEEIEGSAEVGYEVAGRSYLVSGFYREAEKTLALAIEAGGDRAELEWLSQYAGGMAAYLDGEYGVCVAQIGGWLDARAVDTSLLADARRALATIDQLAVGGDRAEVTAKAAALLDRMGGDEQPAGQPFSGGI